MLVAAVASGVGATRRPALWLVPVVVGVIDAVRVRAGGSFDDSGNEVVFAVIIVVSYLGAAALGWLVTTSARRFAADRRMVRSE